MDFFNKYESTMLSMIEKEYLDLEKRIIRKGIFATKKEKERLEYYRNLYADKLEWYERQLDIEINN